MGSRHTLSESHFDSTAIPLGPPNSHSWTWLPSYAWQATNSSSLLSDQHGRLQLRDSRTGFPGRSSFSDFSRGDSSSASDALPVTLGCLYTSSAYWKGSTGGQTLRGESEGSPGECYFWPFDPGPPGYASWEHMDSLRSAASWAHHRNQLQGFAPFEGSSQYMYLTNARGPCPRQPAVCCSHSAHTTSMHLKQFRLPNRRSKTQTYCITLMVCRPCPRPLRNWAQSPGSPFSTVGDSLPGWCRSLFQAAAFQSRFQEWDLRMAEPQGTQWDDRADRRAVCMVWHPGEGASHENPNSR